MHGEENQVVPHSAENIPVQNFLDEQASQVFFFQSVFVQSVPGLHIC